MINRFSIFILACCFWSCKKVEFPENPGNIIFYHEVNGQMVSVVYLPTAFSPEADGVNDLYKPVINGGMAVLYKLSIYDRWGAKMFETTDKNRGWDGTVKGIKAPLGEYQTGLNLMDTTGYIYDIHSKVLLLK